MSMRVLGTFTVGGLSVGIDTLLPMLQLYVGWLRGQSVSLSGNIDVSAGIDLPNPLELAEQLTALIKSIPQMLFEFPAASASIGAEFSLELAGIEAELLAIELPLSRIQASLSAGGIEAYAYDGPANALGAEVGRYVTGLENAQALVLVARDPAAWAALSTVLMTG